MEEENRCTSCGIKLFGHRVTTFKCPACGKAVIGRCRQCRDQSVKYICPECGFQGP